MIKELIYLLTLLYDSPLTELKTSTLKQLALKGISENLIEELILQSRTFLEFSGVEMSKKISPNQTLYSVFENLGSENNAASTYSLPKQAVSFDKHFFPSETVSVIETEEKLWTKVTDGIEAMSSYTDLGAKAETLLHLLHQYTISIPEPTGLNPDVSWYDYTKMLAANTLAIYDYLEAQECFVEGFELAAEEKPMVLIAGDLSGIQSFIYDIVSKSAAKNLKGRSFYLQLLNDSIIQKIKEICGLFDANIVYDSGGGFLMLAANVEVVNTAFDYRNVNSFIQGFLLKLYSTHKTAFYFSIATEAYGIKDSENGFAEVMKNLLEKKLNKYKQRPFSELIKGDGPLYHVFEPGLADVIRDKITGERIAESNLKTSWSFDLENAIFPKPSTSEEQLKGENLILKETADQIFIGAALKDADYWIISHQSLPFFPKRMAFQPCDLGIYHYLVPANYMEEERLSKSKVRIYQINNILYPFKPTAFGNNHILGFRLYAGKGYPQDKWGNAKTFNELAGSFAEDKIKNLDQSDFGFKRLGVLRMDVDDLGSIFKNVAQKGLAYYACLSRSLDHFFKGYLYHLWQNDEAYKEFSQIIYAGGDDLFIVGRWDLMLKMAKEIKTAFAEWTCHNPRLSISGGMAVVTHKFPIIKAADLAAVEEKKAKNWFYTPKAGSEESKSRYIFEKNTFSLFGMPLHWGSLENEDWLNEFEMVEEFKEGLLKLMNDEDQKLSRSFLQKIQNLYAVKNEAYDGTSDQYKWKWMLANELSKFKESIRPLAKYQSHFVMELIKKYTTTILQNNYQGKSIRNTEYDFITLLNIASRWAELEYRTRIISF